MSSPDDVGDGKRNYALVLRRGGAVAQDASGGCQGRVDTNRGLDVVEVVAVGVFVGFVVAVDHLAVDHCYHDSERLASVLLGRDCEGGE